jgi:hypothetical protein
VTGRRVVVTVGGAIDTRELRRQTLLTAVAIGLHIGVPEHEIRHFVTKYPRYTVYRLQSILIRAGLVAVTPNIQRTKP